MAEVPAGAILGMGNPLLDISANVGLDFLEKYGLEENMACLAEPKHLPMYEEIQKEPYKADFIPGGATQNTMRVAQWLLGKDCKTSFIGCVGKDSYSEILRKSMADSNVVVEYQEDAETQTGTCGVLITGDHRTLCANISAANNYKIDHLNTPAVWKHVQTAQMVYMSGFFLTVSPPSIMKVAEYCNEHNKMFVMNLAAPFICEFFKDPLAAAVPYMDVIFGNETEALAFSKANGFDTEDHKEIARKILALPKKNGNRGRIVVITQGHDPIIVAEGDSVVEYPVELIAKEDMVDTNSAGDSFVGGFLAELARGKSTKDCVKAGSWCAGEIIKQEGCTLPAVCNYKV